MRRLQGPSKVPYVFAIIIFLPPAAWVLFYKGGQATNPVVFIPMLLAAVIGGAWFGNQLGLKAQVKFQEDLRAYFEREKRLSRPGNEKDS